MKKRLSQFLIFLICLNLALPGTGESAPASKVAETSDATIHAETKELCNQVIANIYREILQQKGKYKDLTNFDDGALYENKYGIYTLVYQFGDNQPEVSDPRRLPYAFGLTIDSLEDQTFPVRPDSFNFSFPYLGVKISGYQKKHRLRTQFNILPLVKKYGNLLADYQQKFLPLRLQLRPLKEFYRVRENVEFEVTLTNVSKRHMIVKALGAETLLFLLNDQFWGTFPSSSPTGGRELLLKSGQSINLRFKGESFQRPTDVAIFAEYRMSVGGVNPTGVLRIHVVDEDYPAQ